MALQVDNSIASHIFRAYDIRGRFGSDLTPALACQIGQAFGSEAISRGVTQVAVGYDGRLSGPVLLAALTEGLQQSGCDVVHIGQGPTPLLYFATTCLPGHTGIMITGSHNPAEYNGFKMVMQGRTLASGDISQLCRRIEQQDFSVGKGSLSTHPMEAAYVAALCKNLRTERPLSVVVDAGHGAAGPIALAFLGALGCEITPLYCDINGHFPHHHPDPSQAENLQDLINAVIREKADIGLAFDGDGDRLGIVTATGRIIWPDQLAMIFAEAVLAETPGASIVFDVKCARALPLRITAKGGRPVMSRTGHAFIKQAMLAEKAAFGGEMSGHFFFADRWYGFDDGCYAAGRLLEILAKVPDIAAVWDTLPQCISTPEIQIPISDAKKFDFMQKFVATATFPGAERITIDGLRVEWAAGWGLVRASNTTPCLVVRFEADTEAELQRIQSDFRAQLQQCDATLAVSF